MGLYHIIISYLRSNDGFSSVLVYLYIIYANNTLTHTLTFILMHAHRQTVVSKKHLLIRGKVLFSLSWHNFSKEALESRGCYKCPKWGAVFTEAKWRPSVAELWAWMGWLVRFVSSSVADERRQNLPETRTETFLWKKWRLSYPRWSRRWRKIFSRTPHHPASFPKQKGWRRPRPISGPSSRVPFWTVSEQSRPRKHRPERWSSYGSGPWNTQRPVHLPLNGKLPSLNIKYTKLTAANPQQRSESRHSQVNQQLLRLSPL